MSEFWLDFIELGRGYVGTILMTLAMYYDWWGMGVQ